MRFPHSTRISAKLSFPAESFVFFPNLNHYQCTQHVYSQASCSHLSSTAHVPVPGGGRECVKHPHALGIQSFSVM